MKALLVGAALAAAVLVLLPSRVEVPGGTRRVVPAAPSAPVLLSRSVTVGSAVLLGAAVGLVVGGPAGALGALATAAGALVVPGRLAARSARPGALDAAEAALAGELMTACVEAGLPLTAALHQVSAAMPGPTGAALGRAAQTLAVGAEPTSALGPLLAQRSTARLARSLVRALTTGAAPGPVLAAASAGQRDQARSARVSRARGIGSKAALPVGLCFLPAFVLVAVVPVVVGGLGQAVPGP